MSGDLAFPSDGAVTVQTLEEGAVWHVRLATPKANILDATKIEILTSLFRKAAETRDLRAVILDSEGPHFSFGASVEEHLPGQVQSMIRGFHGLFDAMLESSVVTLAAVRGQCLGGGLELASFCHRVFASPEAHLGQPEIVLGVFAPVASVVLAERIGRSRAEDLCLSGRSLDATEAHRIGLVDQIDADPTAAACSYARDFLAPRSASSLRFAVRALRQEFAGRFRTAIAGLEPLYLEELMKTRDAQEGLQAFLEKRSPTWSHS